MSHTKTGPPHKSQNEPAPEKAKIQQNIITASFNMCFLVQLAVRFPYGNMIERNTGY